MVLNTIFLVREIRRNEQHDSFINAVTHELKTPVASIRLYLQTLQTRELERTSGASSTASCSRTAIGCCIRSSRCCGPAAPGLSAAADRADAASISREIARECVELARTRFHLADRSADVRGRATVGATIGARRLPTSSRRQSGI